MPRLDEVFKKAGVPTRTFVRPAEFERVLVALQTPGRSLIVEGPSGMGKTSCVKRALEEAGMEDSCLFLSARKTGDQQLIRDFPTARSDQTVVVDDVHRLPNEVKRKWADFLKHMADDEKHPRKAILIGAGRVGRALAEYAPELPQRIEIVPFALAEKEQVRSLLSLGETALNCRILIAEELVDEASGSFALAQMLGHEACVQGHVLETQSKERPVEAGLPAVREAVLRELSLRLTPVALDFVTGNRSQCEGGEPYFHLLRRLAETADGVLDTRHLPIDNPYLKADIAQAIKNGHLDALIGNSETIGDAIGFDASTGALTIEDPRFLYFIRHLSWPQFAAQAGYPKAL